MEVKVTDQPCPKTLLDRPPASAYNETQTIWHRPTSHRHLIIASSMQPMQVSSSMVMGLMAAPSHSMSPDSLKDIIRCHRCTIQSLQGQFKCFRKKLAPQETVLSLIQMVARNQPPMQVEQPTLSTSARGSRTRCELKASRKVKSRRMGLKVSGRPKMSC